MALNCVYVDATEPILAVINVFAKCIRGLAKKFPDFFFTLTV
jgi:hypothetical protein